MEGETKNKNVLFISSENSCINWDNNKAKIYNLDKNKIINNISYRQSKKLGLKKNSKFIKRKNFKKL
jgi:hypothetical protein